MNNSPRNPDSGRELRFRIAVRCDDIDSNPPCPLAGSLLRSERDTDPNGTLHRKPHLGTSPCPAC